ncbi:MAG: hypothetical protein Q9191_008277 [Dirinaria sp. TL-2023a]
MSVTAEVPNEVRENVRVSSSPGLSSPPTPSSPTQAKPLQQSPFHTNSGLQPDDGQNHAINGGEEFGGAKNTLAPVKKPRKKRDPANTVKKQSDSKNGTTASTASDGKDPAVKTRKPRAAPGTSTRGRKPKAAATTHVDVAQGSFSGQSKIIDTLAPAQPLAASQGPPTTLMARNGNIEAIPTMPGSNVPTQKLTPRFSGQNYDPIRSSAYEVRSISSTPSNLKPRFSTPPRPPNYGSASNSPSISSLIDPPGNVHYPQLKRNSEGNDASPPKRFRLTPPEQPLLLQHVPEPVPQPTILSDALATADNAPTPMELDKNEQITAKPDPVVRKSATSTGTSTPGNTAAKARQKEAPVAISSGNGLLSSAVFSGADGTSGTEKTAPTIILDVPLNGENNKYVNFARLAEERYGFNALHPRLAAQRERLAKVAAAGAALENAEKRGAGSGMSGDDMSVDLSEGEGAGDDSNAEMGGMSLIERDVLGVRRSDGDGSEGPVVKRKKRVMKEDQYDKDDPFVDDAELAWEEQAAASKDGFFVYSGPLVPEGEKPNVERAEGPPKRGRGGGRGRGSTRGTRGGGRGGAGGGGASAAAAGTRKPRITKAEKMERDKEKVQRESMAPLAAKPTNFPI